ncbi:MAG: methyltransferase domain-containing protein [Clostridiaceae bacterium]|nr:methyltransferase domain-containing protein [Clostridiaceae bacterium]
MDTWNAKQYLMFENERTQPAIDLANRLYISNSKKILDIGCGPGNSSKVLRDKFPNSYILGVDYSQDMINKATKEYADIYFKVCDVNNELYTLI